MIDLTRIRSIPKLEEMKEALEFFLREPIVRDIYLNDYQWGEEDFEADIESAQYMLEKVEARIKSLGRMKVNRPKGKRDLRRCKHSEPKEVPQEGSETATCDCDPCTSNDTGPSEASPQQ